MVKTEASVRDCLPDIDVSRDFSVPLADGSVMQAKSVTHAAGLASAEFLVQAAVTVATGVSVRILGEALWRLISKSDPVPAIRIGTLIVKDVNEANIEAALNEAFAQTKADKPKTDE